MTEPTEPLKFGIRNATQWDVPEVSSLLAAALASKSVGFWVVPEPDRRRFLLRSFYDTRVVDALVGGSARIAVAADGALLGAALWLPCVAPVPGIRKLSSEFVETAGAFEVSERIGQLLDAAWQPHAPEPHQRLIGLGVLEDSRRRGVATALLTDRQHDAVRPIRCLVVDDAVVGLCQRCEYREFCIPALLRPGAVIIRSLAFAPEPPLVRVRNTAAARYSAGTVLGHLGQGLPVVRPRRGGCS